MFLLIEFRRVRLRYRNSGEDTVEDFSEHTIKILVKIRLKGPVKKPSRFTRRCSCVVRMCSSCVVHQDSPEDAISNASRVCL